MIVKASLFSVKLCVRRYISLPANNNNNNTADAKFWAISCSNLIAHAADTAHNIGDGEAAIDELFNLNANLTLPLRYRLDV